MARRTVIRIETEKLMSLARKYVGDSDNHLSTEDKARWVKIQGPGGKLYIPKGKLASTVHISGFRVDPTDGAVRDLTKDEQPTGKVTQELNFGDGRTEAQVLESFELLFMALASTEAPAPKVPAAETVAA